MTKYGFYYNQQRCSGCRVCQIACKDRFDLQNPGAMPRRVTTIETGTYPNVQVFNLSIGCNHCDDPACVKSCATGALYKDAESGIVLYDDTVCIGCKTCVSICPYGAPQFDESASVIVKCDSCKALRDAGKNPVCVDACCMRALDFGPVDELKAKYGDDLVSEMPCLGESTTEPNIYIKSHVGAVEATSYTKVVL